MQPNIAGISVGGISFGTSMATSMPDASDMPTLPGIAELPPLVEPGQGYLPGGFGLDALDLARAKAAAEVGFAVLSVAALAAATPFLDGRAFAASLAHAAPDTTAALATAVVWCGAVTCAYTIWAQSFGQRGVTAARANLVYTSQPVFSALFAFGLLHEVPTAATLAGGGLILIAVAAEVLAMDEAPA